MDRSWGEILKIETVIMPGKGKMQITGKLGDVMQKSLVKAAKSYIRSKSLDFGIIPPIFEKRFSYSFPEGELLQKDGQQVLLWLLQLYQLITEIPVNRDVAMTGEVTLRGVVLPIGGLKEKLLAAQSRN